MGGNNSLTKIITDTDVNLSHTESHLQRGKDHPVGKFNANTEIN